MSSGWEKQPQYITTKYLNGGSGDAVVGGILTGVPSAINASQGNATRPGDRIVLGAADALALSDTVNVGTLYGGIYMYLTSKATSTATPTRAHAMFWDTGVSDSHYQATPDEPTALLFAGVSINTLTKGNSWWVVCLGKAVCKFANTLTTTGADGQAVFLAAAGAGVNVGTFDNFGVGSTVVPPLLNKYVGMAEGAPAASTASLVDMRLFMYRV